VPEFTNTVGRCAPIDGRLATWNARFERHDAAFVVGHLRSEPAVLEQLVPNFVDRPDDGDELGSQPYFGLDLPPFEAGQALVRLAEALVRLAYFVPNFDEDLSRHVGHEGSSASPSAECREQPSLAQIPALGPNPVTTQ